MTRLIAAAVLLALAIGALGARAASHLGAAFDGEVRRVDRDAKKITIRHGPMPSLDMPAHTMVFQVRDAALLDRVKPGDKVKFQAQKVGGAFLLLELEKVE